MPRPKLNAKKLHKYVGLPLCALLLFASISGILLNHRGLLRQIDVPRWMLPSHYRYQGWNNGAIRGAASTSEGTYLYGTAGIWRTDSALQHLPEPQMRGLAPGGDEQRMMTIVTDSLDRLWAISQFRLYQRAPKASAWTEMSLPPTLHGRLTDVQIQGDSLILLSRSQVYVRSLAHGAWREVLLPAPDGYTGKLLLFQLIWALHSGEYFGLGGRLIVDLIGVVLILLSLSGIGYTFYSSRLRRAKEKGKELVPVDQRRKWAQGLAHHDRWHRWFGHWFFWAVVFVTTTGWMLRPPLMLPLIFSKAKPIPGTALYSENPWFERLRALRFDAQQGKWLLATSEGFFTMSSLGAKPERWTCQPPVSPMGINVFEQRSDGTWLIGSFSGLYEVRPQDRLPLTDYFTGEQSKELKHVRPVTPNAVTGILLGPTKVQDLVVRYEQGITSGRQEMLPQPEALNELPYSLWQYALEWHTGRIYRPLIGSVGVDLFIFLFGLATSLVLWTGHKRLRRKSRTT